MRLVALLLVTSLAALAQTDWPVCGHEPDGMRRSSLTQVTRANVVIRTDVADKDQAFGVPSKTTFKITLSKTQEI